MPRKMLSPPLVNNCRPLLHWPQSCTRGGCKKEFPGPAISLRLDDKCLASRDSRRPSAWECGLPVACRWDTQPGFKCRLRSVRVIPARLCLVHVRLRRFRGQRRDMRVIGPFVGGGRRRGIRGRQRPPDFRKSKSCNGGDGVGLLFAGPGRLALRCGRPRVDDVLHDSIAKFCG